MSFVNVVPNTVAAAAGDLASIRSALSEATAAAAGPTTDVLAAGGDEVSTAISQLFGAHGQEFQVVSAQLRGFHDQLVRLMRAGAAAYASVEATAQQDLSMAEQGLVNAVNAPAQALLGHPIIGTGGSGSQSATTGTSTSGVTSGSVASGSAAGSVSSGATAGTVSTGATTGSVASGATAGTVSTGATDGAVTSGTTTSSSDGTTVSAGGVAATDSGSDGGVAVSDPGSDGGVAVSGSGSGSGVAVGGTDTPGTSAPAPVTPNTFGDVVAAPYQTLISNTVTNLQSLDGAWAANPAPFLHQLIANQMGYAQTAATALQSSVSNLPAALAHLPADIQLGTHSLMAADPGAFLHSLVTNQLGYAQTISTALQSAAHDFGTGAAALPAAYQAAFQDFMAGNVSGAADHLESGMANLFITGFDVTAGSDAVLSITPTGTVGDLLPILGIPGQMAQNFTNLLPAGSVPGLVSQNFTNIVNAATNTAVTSTLTLVVDPSSPTGIGVAIDATMGLPLALGVEALGGPVDALDAFGTSATAFVTAAQSGNVLAATAAVLDAPAVVANGLFNGQSTFPLTIDALGIPTTLNLPMDGILVPAGPYTATIPDLGVTATVNGTPLGGVAPGLLTLLPEQLAEAIGASPVTD
ncbi:PE family protein [Mycobacterium marinum]|uniref:PE family protein n=1 Tax=Mycobacterium marinum TaxID=1781 RepID=UPI00235989CB|nr:PE family protein [Mycobacterium marinum]MDC8983991.1 PE family protein [Mycobacterium marinum]MDC9001066.1 PE family protein [Mycobacterium marinum]MDC9011316.1 PE family protein [Mycobacterium marinum]